MSTFVGPPNVAAEVTFLSTAAGGRKSPTAEQGRYCCPMRLGDEYFDACIDLSATGSIGPGQSLQCQLWFLWPEGAMSNVSVGKEFTLHEGKLIGHGKITAVYAGT